MALYSDLPVHKSTYDLLLAIFYFTKDFGKEYKYTVGESREYKAAWREGLAHERPQ